MLGIMYTFWPSCVLKYLGRFYVGIVTPIALVYVVPVPIGCLKAEEVRDTCMLTLLPFVIGASA
jgi:hypothetical protein